MDPLEDFGCEVDGCLCGGGVYLLLASQHPLLIPSGRSGKSRELIGAAEVYPRCVIKDHILGLEGIDAVAPRPGNCCFQSGSLRRLIPLEEATGRWPAVR